MPILPSLGARFLIFIFAICVLLSAYSCSSVTINSPSSGNIYDAHAHPEYDINGGQTFFVTYSRATGAFTSEIRLVAVEVKPAL